MLTLMINGKPMEIATASATLADVVTRMGLEGKRIAIERNGEIVPRSRYATTSRRERRPAGDRRRRWRGLNRGGGSCPPPAHASGRRATAGRPSPE